MADLAASTILLTGGSGQVGGQLRHTLPVNGIRVVAPGRTELDLASSDSIRGMMRSLRPQWVINAAAYTAVDKAESDVDAAFAINRDAPALLAEEAKALGIPMIHFSTDYVFDGTKQKPYKETDTPNPLGVYGASKLAGEQALAASGVAYLNIRTSWVYGPAGKNFLLTILRAAREREELRIVSDQHGAPTSSFDLAAMATLLIQNLMRKAAKENSAVAEVVMEARGDYHFCDSGETTWFGFAEEILKLAREREPQQKFARLTPITTAEYPTPARRPANSRLDCAKLVERFGAKWPAWQQSLAAVMQKIPKEPA